MILYFSATGNSRYVARLLAEELGDRRSVDLSPLLKGQKTKEPLSVLPGERIGFVFPVHCWGMPKVLARLTGNLPLQGIDNAGYTYMVCTCGDDTGLTAAQWRKCMEKAGLHGAASFSVAMPNTYVLLPGFDVDAPEVARRKVETAPEAVHRIAEQVKAETAGDFTHHGSVAWLKSKVVYPLFEALLFDKPFRVDEGRCVSCGACERVCPTGNISLSGSPKHPTWHGRCINCLACYHRCPAECIEFGKVTCSKGHYHGVADYVDQR